jgi:hypothetical protein
VIVPQRALDSAGLDYRTIQPVDVKPDRWDYTLHRSDVAPSNMLPLDETPLCYYSFGDHYRTDGEGAVGWLSGEGGRQAVKVIDDEFRWYTARHWLGDCVFTAEGRSQWDHASQTYVPTPRAFYVSSFDRQEHRPLYFLSALPHSVTTFDEGIESLSPDSVKTALELGRDVVRQGDMFAIKMSVTRRELKKAGATFAKRKVTITPTNQARKEIERRDAINSIMEKMPAPPVRQYGSTEIYQAWRDAMDAWSADLVARMEKEFPHVDVNVYSWQSASMYKPTRWEMVRRVDGAALYGTAHTATEVATLPDGRQFATGTLYHDPAVIGESRDADHARRKLGKSWFLLARNTVPVRGSGTGRRNAA